MRVCPRPSTNESTPTNGSGSGGYGHVFRRHVQLVAACSNENRNSMIRCYLPKHCEIRMSMAKEVREIVDETDNRPMRVRTPAETFTNELLNLQT